MSDTLVCKKSKKTILKFRHRHGDIYSAQRKRTIIDPYDW